MKTTLDIIKQLQTVIEKKLNVKDFSVLLDYPDSDRCKKATTIFITPDNGMIEGLTVNSDMCSLDSTIYIICKRKDSDTLMENVFSCFENLYLLLRSNPTLDGYISDTIVNDFDYYPSTETTSEKAIEVRITQIWEKDF